METMHNFSLFGNILRVASWPGLVRTMEAGATKLLQDEADQLTRKMPGTWAIKDGGAWTLEDNDTWNIPDGLSGTKFEVKSSGWCGFQHTTGLKGLAVGLTGQIFGVRTLSKPTQEGYAMHGRVSVGGKKYGAFTSTRLFQRADGSLVDVDVLILCRGW